MVDGLQRGDVDAYIGPIFLIAQSRCNDPLSE